MPQVVGTLRVPVLASAPAAPLTGQTYFNSGTNLTYFWDGTGWVSQSGVSSLAPWSVVTGHLTVTPDNTYDIGAAAATRPRDLNLGRNLVLGGSAARILGDFSNATLSNQVIVQSSTTNGTTNFGAMPNGTGGLAAHTAYGGSDPTNASFMQVGVDTPNGIAYLDSFKTGTGVTRPLVFRTAGTERMRIDAAGAITFSSATVTLPTSTVTTAMIAANAVHALIGSYTAAPTFSTTTTGTWMAATPVTTGAITCSGVQTRIECTVAVQHSVANALVYTGLWIDGALWTGLSSTHIPIASGIVTVTWAYYMTPGAGSHTFQLAVHNATAGTFSLYSGNVVSFYVTEQRR